MENELNLENVEPKATFETQTNELSFDAPKSSGGGTKDYEKLENLPSINNEKLIGNKTLEELGITDIELITKLKPEDIEEDLEPNQVYNGNAIHDLARLFGMTLAELVETLPQIITEFDIEKTYEDSEVYNANAIHQLLELFVYEITMIQEAVESYDDRISALETATIELEEI